MTRLGALISAALVGTGVPALAERFDLGYKSYTTGDRAKIAARGSIAKRNRWTGKPHEDKRAMARLAKQQARHV